MSQVEKKRPFRTFLFWVHLTVGVVGGLVILIMSATGVLLMYERQIVEWVDGPPPVPTPAEGARRLGPDALLAASGLQPEEIGGLTVYSDPAKPATVRRADRKTVYLDPYTGAVLPKADGSTTSFFRTVTEWHRYIALGGETSRPIGKAITGASNLGFLFLVLSGFYLWWPRRWTRQSVRAVTVFNTRLAGKAKDFNWHNSVGFWCAPILALVVAGGVFISYRWPRVWLDKAFGETSPVLGGGAPRSAPAGGERGDAGARRERREGDRPAAGRGDSGSRRRETAPLDGFWSVAERQLEGWSSISVPSVPARGDTLVRLTITTRGGRRPTDRATLSLNPATGAVLAWQPYSALSTNRKIQAWPRWIHTGEAAGWIGQTLAGLASAGGVLLVWTGLSLALRRFRAWRSPGRAVQAQDAKPARKRREKVVA
jgi:uncharacterized iron-regulated membrane protein